MKNCLAILLIFFSLAEVGAQDLLTEDMREAFFEATFDLEKAASFFEKIDKINNPSPTLLAYRGAIEAILVKTKWNPFAKFDLLNKSRNSLNNAISLNSDDLEIRFLRFAVENSIPTFLGYSKNLTTDKKFIMDNLHYFQKDEHLNDQMIGYIIKFLVESGQCSREEINRVKARMNIQTSGI